MEVSKSVDQLFFSAKVIPVDMKALQEKAKGLLKEYLEDDEWVEARTIAIFRDKSGNPRVLDNECVEGSLEVQFYRHGPGFFGIAPEFRIRMKPDEVPTTPEITVKEFMGQRYGYNSRILSNMESWVPVFSGK